MIGKCAHLATPIALLIACQWAPGPAFARSEASQDGTFCKTPMTASSFLVSDASKDLYNSLLWLAGISVVNFGVKPHGRWSGTNTFDTGNSGRASRGFRFDAEICRARQ